MVTPPRVQFADVRSENPRAAFPNIPPLDRFPQPTSATTTSADVSSPLPPVSAQVDLVFQRANLVYAQSERLTTRRGAVRMATGELPAVSGARVVKAEDMVAEEGDVDNDDDDDAGDGGLAMMVLHEFIAALVRIAWDCFPMQARRAVMSRSSR